MLFTQSSRTLESSGGADGTGEPSRGGVPHPGLRLEEAPAGLGGRARPARPLGAVGLPPSHFPPLCRGFLLCAGLEGENQGRPAFSPSPAGLAQGAPRENGTAWSPGFLDPETRGQPVLPAAGSRRQRLPGPSAQPLLSTHLPRSHRGRYQRDPLSRRPVHSVPGGWLGLSKPAPEDRRRGPTAPVCPGRVGFPGWGSAATKPARKSDSCHLGGHPPPPLDTHPSQGGE